MEKYYEVLEELGEIITRYLRFLLILPGYPRSRKSLKICKNLINILAVFIKKRDYQVLFVKVTKINKNLRFLQDLIKITMESSTYGYMDIPSLVCTSLFKSQCHIVNKQDKEHTGYMSLKSFHKSVSLGTGGLGQIGILTNQDAQRFDEYFLRKVTSQKPTSVGFWCDRCCGVDRSGRWNQELSTIQELCDGPVDGFQ